MILASAASPVSVPFLAEIILILATVTLALVTWVLNRNTRNLNDSTAKLYQATIAELGRANDNVTDVALAEIDAHSDRVQRINRIKRKGHGKVAQ